MHIKSYKEIDVYITFIKTSDKYIILVIIVIVLQMVPPKYNTLNTSSKLKCINSTPHGNIISLSEICRGPSTFIWIWPSFEGTSPQFGNVLYLRGCV